MNDQSFMTPNLLADRKFEDRETTALGGQRASVKLTGATTLWFNTGTLCNIECTNCYIESSPSNDRLVFIDTSDVAGYLDQISQRNWPVREIAFTGGEPFLNPHMGAMARLCLERGFDVLILTNAMRPMMRSGVKAALCALVAEFGDQLTLRVSLDHFSPELHDSERGKGCFDTAIAGLDWLRDQGLQTTVAGRMMHTKDPGEARDGYATLFAARGYAIDAQDPNALVLFPEMDATRDVPEITTECWDILGIDPRSVMCASSRMIVKRKGAASATVLACTLLPYAADFELGETLEQAEADVFLNHRFCAQFCVLGGASCSRKSASSGP